MYFISEIDHLVATQQQRILKVQIFKVKKQARRKVFITGLAKPYPEYYTIKHVGG